MAAPGAWLMSDGYWAYRDYDNRLRCLTHLLRKARGLEESLDASARHFGRTLCVDLQAVMAAVYAAREGPPATALQADHAQALNGLLELCLQHAEATHAKTRALARELLNDWDACWLVRDHAELPSTRPPTVRVHRRGPASGQHRPGVAGRRCRLRTSHPRRYQLPSTTVGGLTAYFLQASALTEREIERNVQQDIHPSFPSIQVYFLTACPNAPLPPATPAAT